MKFFKSILGKKESLEITHSPISSSDFKKRITKYVAPKLRKQGWKGTGWHYRKFTDTNCIFCLSFQPNKYGGECWVEIGVHLDFLKNIGRKDYDLKNITCHSLDIRRRISPDKTENYAWKYKDTDEKNELIIKSIWDTFITDGQEFMDQFNEFPKPFLDIEITDIDKRDENYQIKGIPLPPDVRTAWYLSQVYLYIGETEKAEEFADFGLSRIHGQVGSALKADLEKIKTVANTG